MGKQAALKLEVAAARPPDDMEVHLVPLDQIRPAPWNPPARMDPKTVEELAESIATAGQQIPVLLRPVDLPSPQTSPAAGEGVRYEVVFGHRRLAAMHLLAGRSFTYAAAHRDPDGAITIKAFVRIMSEEDAMILSGIENLQRQGFSDLEEAEFFRACGERYGAAAVKILAEKLSVSDRYIRKRVEILQLPEPALDMWKSGKWHVGHMEQLLRLGGADEVLAFLEFVGKRFEYFQGGLDKVPVYQLKECVDNLAIPLSHARFDKSDCKVCRKNTDCQLRLFGGEKDKAKCLDQKCFQERQQAWLDVHWATCKANKWGTQAGIIGGYSMKSTGSFGGYQEPEPGEKCATCAFFTTVLNIKAEPQFSSVHRLCMGEKACYAEVRATQKIADGGTKIEPTDPDAPRVEWHGEFYRQEFYKEEVPRCFEQMLGFDPRKMRLALAVAVYKQSELHKWLYHKLGKEIAKDHLHYGCFYLSLHEIIELLKPLDQVEIEKLLYESTIHDAFTVRSKYADLDRQAIAEYFEADWTRFAVTEDYLNKKTRPELIRFVLHDSGLAEDDTFILSLASRSKGKDAAARLEKMKKPELIDLILNCGIDLHGRLPREIADRPKLGGNQ